MCSRLPSLLSPSPVTFHLSPALAQRVIGTLSNSSAHTLAIWQPGPPEVKMPNLSDKPATAWQSGKLAIQPKYEAYMRPPPRQEQTRSHFALALSPECRYTPIGVSDTRRVAPAR